MSSNSNRADDESENFGVCVTATLLLTAPARATIVYVTYTGTMRGTDTLGFFGAASAELNNVAYTASYVFNVDYIVDLGLPPLFRIR